MPKDPKNPIKPRWKPGESGNPKGRAKGVQTWKTAINTALEAIVSIKKKGPDGKEITEKKTSREAIIARLIAKAINGDVHATKLLMERTEGMAKQDVTITDERKFIDYDALSDEQLKELEKLHKAQAEILDPVTEETDE